ncbi:hypothetical protein ACHWQZ_G018461 [Mnemiopsis leidyi]
MSHDTLELVCYISYRLLLPAVLAVAACIRISLVSLMWLMFFLVVPCLPKFSFRNWLIHKSLRVYIILLLIISTLACCGHVVYWALELSNKLDISVSSLCNSTNILLMNIGYQSLQSDVVPNVLDRVRLIMPDFVVFLMAVVTTILCFHSPVSSPDDVGRGVNLTRFWRTIEPFVTSLFFFLAGVAAPSLIGGIYFFTFMVISTFWAVGVKFGKLPHLKLFMLMLCGAQIVTLYIYQFEDIHKHLPPETLTARLLGYVQYYNRTCKVEGDAIVTNPLHLQFTDNLQKGNFALVFCLAGLYYALGLSARYMIKLLSTEGRPANTYNTITVDGALEDAAAIRGSIRSRHDSFASSYHPEDEGTFYLILRFITNLLIDQVYLLTLAILMLWSITYISWMEFVLLVLVCFLCICPKAKEASYSVAYPLVGYGTILVSIQYIYGLNLTEEELGSKSDIGLRRDTTERGKPAFVKALFLTVFWLHLRAFLHTQNNSVEAVGSIGLRRNRYTKKHKTETYGQSLSLSFKSLTSFLAPAWIHMLYKTVRHAILTYWPAVCYVTLMTASLHSRGINIMRIIYLLFFAAFMFCYVTAKKPLELRILWLWYLLITYSMICVILMYTYQFTQIRKLYTDDKDIINDIGLTYTKSPKQLFTQLLVPMLVLLSVTIQLRVFRTSTDSNDDEEDEGEDIVTEPEPTPEPEPEPEFYEPEEKKRARLKSQTYITNLANNVTDLMKEFWSDSKTVAARGFHISLAIMEMHSPKLVSLAIFYVCVWRVSVINVVLLLVTVVTLPWPLVQYKLTIPIFCWVSWEIFSQLVYQLNMIQKNIFEVYMKRFTTVQCNHHDNSPDLVPYSCGYKDKSDIEWLGYYNMSKTLPKEDVLNSAPHLDNSPWLLVWGYLLVLILLVIQRLLVHYMKGRRSPHVYILRQGIFPDFIFPNITRENAETKISLQLMYLCNNFFVLFGKEVVYIAHVVVAAVRYDVYGFIYIICLGIWKNMPKRTKSKMCMWYIIMINVLIAVQYFLLLGLPPGLCLSYPWCGLQAKKMSLLIWLFLPTTPSTTNQYFIFADFILLLCLTRLWHVFQLQKLDDTLAGALDPSPGPDYANPYNKSTLNTIKLFIFTYLWWVTAAVLFLNAVMTISIFSAGFLIATFTLLWYGSSLLTKSNEYLLGKWELIIIYAYFVVLLKILLQLPSCVAFWTVAKTDSINRLLCPIADVFKLICLQKRPLGHDDQPFANCELTTKSTGLVMDALTFAMVMIQIRVFKSPYFQHARRYLSVLIETSAQGALIMKDRVNKRTRMNLEAEDRRLAHIKQHVAKLKAEHEGRNDFDFGTKELVQEAKLYWSERERREAEADRQRALMYLTHEDVEILSDDGTEAQASELGQDDLSEEGGADPDAASELAGGTERDSGGGDPDQEITADDPALGGSSTTRRRRGGWLKGEDSEIPTEERETPVWSPKPSKPDKPTEEIIVDVLEFSHASFISFIEFTIAWLDDKSGDYRYTSQAIFKERYKVRSNGQTSPPVVIIKHDDGDILDEVPPSSPPSEHMVLRLTTAIYYFCLARTELLCFLFMLLNHAINASLISLFYPIIAFLWGMIAFPRPSGIFWYIVIIYCKISIVVKYIFQFSSIEWNVATGEAQRSNPMWMPNLLGLTKTDQLFLDTVWDLLVLMSVFYHKSCLETAGIWSMWYDTFDDLEEEEIERIVTLPTTAATTAKDIGVDGDTKETSLVERSDEDREDCESGESEPTLLLDTVDFTMLAKLNFVMFWTLLVDKTKKDMPKDMYLPMLVSSLLAFLTSFLGGSAFGKVQQQNKLDVSELLSTNYIPSVILIILLVQFMLMILDRVIYLKKSMIAKYMYQVVVVVSVHAYLFIFQPWFTREGFRARAAWIAWYVFFCSYFTLSAFQIQSGYPRLITDSIILRTYGWVTYVTYLGYLAVPFLWELEVLLNWVCTETTLTLDYWIKLSDIKTYLFKLKCWQVTYESAYYLGEKQPAYMKYGIGGLIVLLLILIIWFPLLFMSVVTTNSIPNPPTGFTCSLSVGGFEPMVSLKFTQVPSLTDEQLDDLRNGTTNTTMKSNNYTEFINKFKATDIARLDVYSDSNTLWEISPAAINYLTTVLDKKNEERGFDVTMRFQWSVLRHPESTTAVKLVSGVSEIDVISEDERDKTENHTKPFVDREDLLQILKTCDTTMKLKVNGLIPSFIWAQETDVTHVDLFPNGDGGQIDQRNMKNVDVSLQHYSDPNKETEKCTIWDGYYWSLNQRSEFVPNNSWSNPVDMGSNPNKIQFYIFSDRIVSSQYQLIASYGIIGLYISVVLVIFKFVRLTLADSHTRIIFQEMPCPDLIMNLVSSTEMVRAQGEFVLEQVLFRKILLLYRSPETLIVWTGRHRRLKEE